MEEPKAWGVFNPYCRILYKALSHFSLKWDDAFAIKMTLAEWCAQWAIACPREGFLAPHIVMRLTVPGHHHHNTTAPH